MFTISTHDTNWFLVPVTRCGGRGRGLATTRTHRRPRRPRPASQEEQEEMTITTPRGFRAAGVPAGLKSTGAKDVALVVNDGPTHDSASVFTANRCKANPVLWSQEVVKDGTVRAVFLNSGGANCYTGPEGFQTTHAVAETGRRPPRHRRDRRRRLLDRPDRADQRPPAGCSTARDAAYDALAADGGQLAAEAIMTTDSVSKQVVVEGAGWSIGGMAKGAGMLAPQLATMLVVLTTDAVVPGRRPGHRAPRRHPGQLRPARLRRLHVDQRHGDRAGQRRERHHAVAAGLHRRADPGLHRPGDAAAARRGGRRPRDRHHRAQRGQRGRRRRGRPQRGPQQPVQGRGLRQGPQLGTGPGQHRYDERRSSTRPTSTSR